MNIIHIAPEIAPFSEYSSVAESINGLCRGSVEMGENVTVFTPLYSSIDSDKFNLTSTGLKTWVDAGFTVYEYELLETTYDRVHYIFFKNAELFGRIGIYGAGSFDYADNDIRFGTFCQACLNYIKYHDVAVDIIHTHEWSTALIPVYKALKFPELKCKTVLTVYSIENLGVFNKFSLEPLNLPWDIYNINNIEYYDNISFLKGGVVFADYVTTISPSFADELLTPDCGLGLDWLFAPIKDKFEGIMKGINYNVWSPESDVAIAANFNADDISGKEKCKKEFTEQLNLDPKLPLLIHASKLLPARGIELLIEGAPKFDEMGINLIITGYGSASYTTTLNKLKDTCKNTRVLLGNFKEYSHKLYAAGDIAIMPSLYEPCGESLLVAMRYGVIPVARKTGGLENGTKQAVKDKVGFTFNQFKLDAMLSSVNDACKLYKSSKYKSAVKTLLGYDFSWKKPTAEYIALYKKLIKKGANDET